MRRTLEGTKIKRQHVSGFRARMATPGGREVLNRRRAKGRHQIAIWYQPVPLPSHAKVIPSSCQRT